MRYPSARRGQFTRKINSGDRGGGARTDTDGQFTQSCEEENELGRACSGCSPRGRFLPGMQEHAS